MILLQNPRTNGKLRNYIIAASEVIDDIRIRAGYHSRIIGIIGVSFEQ